MVMMVFFVLGWSCTQLSKNIDDLGKKAMVSIGMLCHVTREKPHMAPVNIISDPIDCNGGLLFSINNHLDLLQLHDDVGGQDGSTSFMLFTGMTAVRYAPY